MKTPSMGIFGKLFGGLKKESDFVPSAELMSEDVFWDLIQTSLKKAGDEPLLQEKELEELLHRLPIQDVIAFENRYRQLHGSAYTWSLWGAAYIINGGCSDDSFSYFRDWLIVQGPEVYTKALADPEWLSGLELDEDETDGESMSYVARSVFEVRTGRDMPAEFFENQTISGVEWHEEGDDLARMFPRLWKKYCGGE